jgi:hypothetical protein
MVAAKFALIRLLSLVPNVREPVVPRASDINFFFPIALYAREQDGRGGAQPTEEVVIELTCKVISDNRAAQLLTKESQPS